MERELGEGGMATVYLADDLKHERKVALKVLKPELAAGPTATPSVRRWPSSRFRRRETRLKPGSDSESD